MRSLFSRSGAWQLSVLWPALNFCAVEGTRAPSQGAKGAAAEKIISLLFGATADLSIAMRPQISDCGCHSVRDIAIVRICCCFSLTRVGVAELLLLLSKSACRYGLGRRAADGPSPDPEMRRGPFELAALTLAATTFSITRTFNRTDMCQLPLLIGFSPAPWRKAHRASAPELGRDPRLGSQHG